MKAFQISEKKINKKQIGRLTIMEDIKTNVYKKHDRQ